MDFQIYNCGNARVLLNEASSTNTKNNWNLQCDSDSMDNEEYFSWPNALRIDENKFEAPDSKATARKRKLSNNIEIEVTKITKANGFKITKTVDNNDHPKQHNGIVKKATQSGSSRMPQWQVDDISVLNADIEGSLNGLGSELSNNSYNMSDAILSISGLTVFKQEAPSPTSHDGAVQVTRPSQNHQPAVTQGTVITQSNAINDSNANMLNSTLHQLLGQTGYSNLQNAIDSNLLATSPNVSQDGFGVVSSATSTFTEDSRFQYVLAAATSIATKINEDTLTYLNQGQSYEIKLKKLGDLSMYRGKHLKSVIRVCFHERRLQYMEKEQMSLWQRARPGDRILEVDVPLSYGLHDVVQPTSALNIAHFSWDPTKEVGVYIKVNCISTEFTPKKHGGEKGVPFRIQVETYQTEEGQEVVRRLHAAACQVKVFKLKGADRKHKQDREKILKRPPAEQEKYQPSYECTVLNDIPCDAIIPSPPAGTFSSGSPNNNSPLQQPQVISPKDENLNHLQPPKALPVVPPDNVSAETEQRKEPISYEVLQSDSTPSDTTRWLTLNRFEKYLQTFSSFSGADMLRMSREDFIQICGQVDGIRLYNVLHLKTIAPKLTIYVCREHTAVYNAIFLSTHNNVELLHKLSSLMGVRKEQVRDVYMQGPQSIHVHLNSDVISHIKEQTMFNLEILQENGGYIFVLKPAVNNYYLRKEYYSRQGEMAEHRRERMKERCLSVPAFPAKADQYLGPLKQHRNDAEVRLSRLASFATRASGASYHKKKFLGSIGSNVSDRENLLLE